MSTHNIGFDEEMTKIIFQLSSNIIKYASYLFFCDAIYVATPDNDYHSLFVGWLVGWLL